jgi:hypothetical protein
MGIVESIHLTAFHWVVDDLYRRIGLGQGEANGQAPPARPEGRTRPGPARTVSEAV